MISIRVYLVVAALGMGVLSPLAAWPASGKDPASKGNSGNQNSGGPGSPGGSPGGSQLPGLSYEKYFWPSLTLPTTPHNRAVLCYRLVRVNSSTQPFVLQPLPQGAIKCTAEAQDQPATCQEEDENSPLPKDPCRRLDAEHPLKMGETLVIAIDTTDVDLTQLQLLNINITNQQGGALNPTPLRPSFGNTPGGTSSGAGFAPQMMIDNGAPESTSSIFFLTWPNQLPPDVIPTVSVNTIYTPPAPGVRWRPATFYPAGSVVTSESADGHFYTALVGGVSGPAEPVFPMGPPIFQEGSLWWMDAGTTPPATAKIRSWLANTKYTVNDSVFDADNGHFYTALVTGDSGSPPSDPFPINPARGALREFIVDGAVVWQDIGASPPAGKKPGAWSSVAIYQADEVVGAANHRFYKATTTGKPGALPTQPNFPVAEMNIVQEKPSTLTWQDSGTTAPAAVTAGQAPDQLLNLLTLTLPQAHALYHYNLAAGLVVSSVRAPTFVMQGATATQIDGPRSVDPVLLFTVYFRPIDAESDLKKPLSESPGLTLGLSLSSPSSSFYLGGSSDVLRNIQLVYGVNFTKVARLGPPGTSNLGSTSATPATTAQRYARGVFVGLTFNFSGFVQGLFGGGKGAQ